MKQSTAKKLIQNELTQLDVQQGSTAWDEIMSNCLEAADVLTKTELLQLVADMLDGYNFQARGF